MTHDEIRLEKRLVITSGSDEASFVQIFGNSSLHSFTKFSSNFTKFPENLKFNQTAVAT